MRPVLAVALSTSVDRLLDEDDHRELPDRDLAVLAALARVTADPTAVTPTREDVHPSAG